MFYILFWCNKVVISECMSCFFFISLPINAIILFIQTDLQTHTNTRGGIYCMNQSQPIIAKSNQITFIVTSPQHKCLGEWNSYERAPDNAEKQQTIYLWTDSAKKTANNLPMDRQCKKKQQQTIYLWTDSAKKNNNKQFTYGQTVQKKQQTIYIWTDSAKKQQTIYIWTDSAKKQQTIYIWTDSAKKQQTIYIWTDSAKKKQQLQFTYGQTVQKNNSNLHMDSTYLQTVQKTMCKIHIHILSTLSVL